MTPSQPHRIGANDPAIPAILALIRDSFAYMDGRIDPPSSVHALTENDIAQHCETAEVWAIDTPPRACIFLKRRGDALYLGKLAVAAEARNLGYARRLVDLAQWRAIDAGLDTLELDVRIELAQNHATFARLGFETIARGAHPGFDRPTFLTMRKTCTA